MQLEIDDSVAMNTNGMVLELCEKYYDVGASWYDANTGCNI